MKMPAVFSLLQSWVGGGSLDLLNHYGTVYHGYYEIQGKRVSGGVADASGANRTLPVV
jgi:hypothetical protein